MAVYDLSVTLNWEGQCTAEDKAVSRAVLAFATNVLHRRSRSLSSPPINASQVTGTLQVADFCLGAEEDAVVTATAEGKGKAQERLRTAVKERLEARVLESLAAALGGMAEAG